MTQKLSRRWVSLIFAIQALVGIWEFFSAVECHRSGGECWNAFFAALLNAPLSVLLMWAWGWLPSAWGAEHYLSGVGAFLMINAIVGTLWWSLLIIGIRKLWAKCSGVVYEADDQDNSG